jgi:hypothetical protein
MKDITQCKWMSSSINQRMISMQNTQTCSIANLNLIATIVAFANRQAIEITGYVIHSTSVTIPVWIHVVLMCGGHRSRGRLLLIRIIHLVPTPNGRVPDLAADLAGGERRSHDDLRKDEETCHPE